MKITTFQDMNNQELRVQYSSNGDYRIYLELNDKAPGSTQCILLNKFQALILINALNDLIEDDE